MMARPKQVLENVTETRKTTLIGAATMLTPFVIAAIPNDIRTTCLESVMKSEHPAVTGSLLGVGLGLLLLGPSLKSKG